MAINDAVQPTSVGTGSHPFTYLVTEVHAAQNAEPTYWYVTKRTSHMNCSKSACLREMQTGSIWEMQGQNLWITNHLACQIWGFHSSDYEECHLLGCYAMWLL
jgi:hypothetical protein